MTFPEEYRRIWRRKFTGATFVYLFMRYSAVIERIFFVLEVLVWNSSDKVSMFEPFAQTFPFSHPIHATRRMYLNAGSLATFAT